MIPLRRDQIAPEVADRMEPLARALGGSWRVESPGGDSRLAFPFIVLTEDEARKLVERIG